jgi:hypothetical protein
MSTDLTEIKNPRQLPNYDEMIGDLQAIVVETDHNAITVVIEGYHELGLQIKEFGLDKPAYLPQVAKDIKKSTRTIYKVLQFVNKWGDLQDFYNEIGGDKRVSWHQICNKYLSGAGETEDSKLSVSYDDLVTFIYENANYLADNALYTKHGVTLRVTQEQLEKYKEKENE